jgi:nucleoside-diphosphate-sugar epimerase
VCIAHNVKLIYLSGWEVYSGYRSIHLKANESLPLLPKGPYGEAKYLCETMIEHSRRTQGLRCAMLRSGPVYGIGGDKPRFIYNFIDKIRQSRQIVTHTYNNGLPALDLLYLDDLVAAIVQTTGSEFCGDLNIGTGVVTSTHRIAEILRKLIGGQNEIVSTPIDGDTACIAMDAGKAQRVLGWNATIDIEHGLQLILSCLKTD